MTSSFLVGALRTYSKHTATLVVTKYERIKLSKGAMQVPVAQQSAKGFEFTVYSFSKVTQFTSFESSALSPFWCCCLRVL